MVLLDGSPIQIGQRASHYRVARAVVVSKVSVVAADLHASFAVLGPRPPLHAALNKTE